MADLAPLFDDLKAVFAPFVPRLHAKRDDAAELWLDSRRAMPDGKPRFFGAVQRKAAAVHVHLMPVYDDPSLLDALSPALRKRMQGKSCFRFTALDAAQRDELAALVRAAFERVERQGRV